MNRGQISVTNDADAVVPEVAANYGDRRIIYRDSEGNWDELVHQDGRFICFAGPSEAPQS